MATRENRTTADLKLTELANNYSKYVFFGLRLQGRSTYGKQTADHIGIPKLKGPPRASGSIGSVPAQVQPHRKTAPESGALVIEVNTTEAGLGFRRCFLPIFTHIALRYVLLISY